MSFDREKCQQIFDKYCEKLCLAPDWDVQLRFVEELEEQKAEDFIINCAKHTATLLINVNHLKDLRPEDIIIHELIRLKMHPLEQAADALAAGDFASGQISSDLETAMREMVKRFLVDLGREEKQGTAD